MQNTKSKQKKFNILFVCTGNTCRSAMAEQIFKHFLKKNRILSRFNVKSAGLAAQIDDGMPFNALQALLRLDIKPKEHKARQVSSQLLNKNNLIICMSQRHKEFVKKLTCVQAFTLGEIAGGGDVADPYGGDEKKYFSVANYLSYACKDILDYIKGQSHGLS